MNWKQTLLLSAFFVAEIHAVMAEQVIHASAPGTVFTNKESLEFTLEKPVPSTWIIRDWNGKTVLSGIWKDGGKTPLRLPSQAPGYYTLETRTGNADLSGKRTFAVVVAPETRKSNPDSAFAVDSAQSWLATGKKIGRSSLTGFEIVSELLRRAGVKTVRERMSWSEVEPRHGADLPYGRYAENAALLSSRGINILGMFHDSPPWTRSTSQQLPDDLFALYRFSQKSAKKFAGQIGAWEFWNEEDIGFCKEPAWDYAAALKAASLGFKSADPALPVLIGGIATTPPWPMVDVILKNDAALYFDIFAAHTYRPLKEYPEMIQSIDELLKRNNITGKQLWFTETGTYAEGSGRMQGLRKNLRAHSPDQEILVAEFLPKSMVLLQSLGVDRNFFFVLSPYNEQNGKKDWGLLRQDYSVKPGYAALSTLTSRLANAKLLGEIAPDKAIRAFLYQQPDNTQTLVYWSKSEIDTKPFQPNLTPSNLFAVKVNIPAASGTYSKTDLVGGVSPVTAVNDQLTLECTRFPAYIDGLSGLTPDIPFSPRPRQNSSSDATDQTVIAKVVLSEDFQIAATKDRASLKHIPGRLKLQLFNFSDKAKCGTIAVSGGTVTGLPASVELSAFGKTEFNLEYTPAWKDSHITDFEISGIFNGKPISHLRIPVISLEKMLAEGRAVSLPNTADPLNWRANASGKMQISFNEKGNAVVFHTTFPPNIDRWAYPEYALQLPQESFHGATGLSFEFRPSSLKLKFMLVMATVKGKTVHFRIENLKEGWQTGNVSFDTVDPESITAIKIGFNPDVDDFSWQIRNVKVLYKEKQ